jgi:hypothetical protein
MIKYDIGKIETIGSIPEFQEVKIAVKTDGKNWDEATKLRGKEVYIIPVDEIDPKFLSDKNLEQALETFNLIGRMAVDGMKLLENGKEGDSEGQEISESRPESNEVGQTGADMTSDKGEGDENPLESKIESQTFSIPVDCPEKYDSMNIDCKECECYEKECPYME